MTVMSDDGATMRCEEDRRSTHTWPMWRMSYKASIRPTLTWALASSTASREAACATDSPTSM
jgi:hypothetical protein